MRRAGTDVGALWNVADRKTADADAGGLFEPPALRTYPWERTYTAREAVKLLSTYSPYLALAEERRVRLLEGIERLAEERFGGSVTRRYLAILAVARRSR
ncbi:MAG: hypothetical protein ACRDVW_11325 [Acidimicrobiales bacterium]